MNGAAAWLRDLNSSARTVALWGGLAVAIASIAALSLLDRGTVATFGGTFAGVALFLIGAGFWITQDPDTQERVSLKRRWPVARRRYRVGVFAGLWIIVLLLVGPLVPYALGGALNVFVVLNLVWLWRLAPWEPRPAPAPVDHDE